MAITGGIKFFEKSKCLLKDGGTCEASSGEVVQDFCIDTNPITFWNSVDSDDTTTETLEIRFLTEYEIDRIILQDHNFKQFTIQYWNGSAYVDFTNVKSFGTSLVGGISETVFAQDTAYYEFDAVETALIKISILKTQVANDEKYLSQCIATKELGTLQGYPDIDAPMHSKNIVNSETLSGKANVTKGYDAFSCTLKFDKYPAELEDDLDLIFTLFDSQNPFIVWLCGGRYGSTYFSYALRGFRLKDLYQMQTIGDLPADFHKNVYRLPVNLKLKLVEHA